MRLFCAPRWGVALLLLAALAAWMSVFGGLREGEESVLDVLIVVDVTQSMNVRDMDIDGERVSRLEFAKAAVQQLLSRWPCGSRLALGMFSGHRSFVMFKSVELCAHYQELHSAVGSLDWRAAWVSRSEVSKGLFSAMKELPKVSDSAKLVFVSDGHEAPPLHEVYRPKPNDSVERRKGLIVGVGGEQPVPIPRLGLNGKPQGYWRASQVMQVDRYRLGRGAGEALVGVDTSDLKDRQARGREHLSSLKAVHLESLSRLTQLAYREAKSVEDFAQAMQQPGLWRRVDGRYSVASIWAGVAFACLLLRMLLPWVKRDRP